MATAAGEDRNQEATCYVGDLDQQVSESLLWELCVQCGPVVNVHIPKDKLTQQHMGFGFVEFKGEEDAQYAIKVLNMIKMFGKPIRVNQASREKEALDVGANIFVGNLDPEVDEKLLYDTFSAFGVIVTTPKVMRDPDSGNSRGFGFVSFETFEASDAAIEAMNGQARRAHRSASRHQCNRASVRRRVSRFILSHRDRAVPWSEPRLCRLPPFPPATILVRCRGGP